MVWKRMNQDMNGNRKMICKDVSKVSGGKWSVAAE